VRGAGAGLKEHAAEIQDEFRRVAIEDAATLDSVGNNVWATAANSTSAQSYGPDWKTLALMDRCVWDETNTKLFPVATRLLRELGVPCIEAFYARMTPGSKIKPHSVCPAPRAPRPAPRAPRPVRAGPRASTAARGGAGLLQFCAHGAPWPRRARGAVLHQAAARPRRPAPRRAFRGIERS